jgi:hypothetical protein
MDASNRASDPHPTESETIRYPTTSATFRGCSVGGHPIPDGEVEAAEQVTDPRDRVIRSADVEQMRADIAQQITNARGIGHLFHRAGNADAAEQAEAMWRRQNRGLATFYDATN